MDASAWRAKRTVSFKAPSGSTYKIRLPDPVTLIQTWVEAGVDKPLDQKDLGEKVTKPEVIMKILMRFIVEPKITAEPSEETLSTNELMEDQTDCIALYRKIISPFLDNVDETAEFFRSLGFSVESRVTKPSGPQAPNRGFRAAYQGPNAEAELERGFNNGSLKVSRNSGRGKHGS